MRLRLRLRLRPRLKLSLTLILTLTLTQTLTLTSGADLRGDGEVAAAVDEQVAQRAARVVLQPRVVKVALHRVQDERDALLLG